VKRHKNDATDAEAICEAVTRPNMRFVATKTPEQQSCLTLHRARHSFIRQQTSVINAIRAHLAEFGVVAPVGRHGVEQLLGVVADAGDRVADEATHEGRGYRTRQQNRQNGVGDDGQGRTLQRTSRTRGLNEITPDIRRDVKVGRANST
jgi:transposase